jgi:acetylornithine deacetylase
LKPSLSSEEEHTAALIEKWFVVNEISFENNNVWAYNKYFDRNKPTLLLNSHHDTVRPNQAYTNDLLKRLSKKVSLLRFSNDAGGCLVSLLATFVHFMFENLSYNIVVVASAEEESREKA